MLRRSERLHSADLSGSASLVCLRARPFFVRSSFTSVALSILGSSVVISQIPHPRWGHARLGQSRAVHASIRAAGLGIFENSTPE